MCEERCIDLCDFSPGGNRCGSLDASMHHFFKHQPDCAFSAERKPRKKNRRPRPTPQNSLPRPKSLAATKPPFSVLSFRRPSVRTEPVVACLPAAIPRPEAPRSRAPQHTARPAQHRAAPAPLQRHRPGAACRGKDRPGAALNQHPRSRPPRKASSESKGLPDWVG